MPKALLAGIVIVGEGGALLGSGSGKVGRGGAMSNENGSANLTLEQFAQL